MCESDFVRKRTRNRSVVAGSFFELFPHQMINARAARAAMSQKGPGSVPIAMTRMMVAIAVTAMRGVGLMVFCVVGSTQ